MEKFFTLEPQIQEQTFFLYSKIFSWILSRHLFLIIKNSGVEVLWICRFLLGHLVFVLGGHHGLDRDVLDLLPRLPVPVDRVGRFYLLLQGHQGNLRSATNIVSIGIVHILLILLVYIFLFFWCLVLFRTYLVFSSFCPKNPENFN